MARVPILTALLLAVLVAGCDRRPDDIPVVASAIGGPALPADPSRGPMQPGARLLMDATAQGLVRFSADGQVEPGLAERWTVIDNGKSYIFRLRDARWPDGTAVTAAAVVRALDRAIAPGGNNPLKPYLRVIDEVVEMTPQVIEVRLKRPRPDLLKLFAQPDLAIFDRRTLTGSGPFRVQDKGDTLLLRPIQSADPEREAPEPEEYVRLRGERAALAILRFQRRQSDLVMGGSFADWPLVARGEVAPANIRIDPAIGLFGLVVASRQGFLAQADNRAALSMAIDRGALTQAIQSDWKPVETLLPEQLDSAVPPMPPAWQLLTLDQRREQARARVRAWVAAGGAPVRVRIALPPGPGATLLWAHLARAMLAIGITPERVGISDAAELRLVDAVAPYDSGRWYLVAACQPCSAAAVPAIDAARDAPTLEERSARIAEADRALTADAAYIPLAQPLRWSLVALRLNGWTPNRRAWHPLTGLRKPR